MRTRASRTRLLWATMTLTAALACGSSTPAPHDDLRRDLELARGEGLELAPRTQAQTRISAAELVPQGGKPVSAASSQERRRAPVSAPSKKATTVAEAPAASPPPAQEEVPAAAAPPRPQPARPAMNPAPAGGYKTMGELIRKAPFPINP